MKVTHPTNQGRRETKSDDLRTAVHFENVPTTPPTRTAILETPRVKKKMPVQMKHNDAYHNNLDDVQYFDNLIRDLAEISRLLTQNPSLFRYAHLSLMEEVYNVWGRLRTNPNLLQQSGLHGNPAALKRITPPRSSIDGSSFNNVHTRSSVDSAPSVSPFKKRQMCSGDTLLPGHWMGHFDANYNEVPIHMHKLEKKVFIPEVSNYNFIGRILGPRGISARQIEADTNCKILIRGKGSVKDPEKEARLTGQPGYEHLCDNLHVHITTEGPELADCQRRLERAVSIIESLLTPSYDEYKKTQLLQLAIINGTYRPYKKKQQQWTD